MKATFHTLLLHMAAATGCDMAQQLVYMKIENHILRAKLPQRIQLTAPERNRLLKYGKVLGSAIYQLITIVSVRTFQRWLQAEKQPQPQKPTETKPGRPKTAEEIRELILNMAQTSS